MKGGQVVWVCAFVLLIAACQHASTSSARASAAAVVAVTSGRPTVRLSPVAIAMSDPAPGANPGVRAHLLTAVYCGGYLGSTRDPSQLARYVDWCANPSQKNVAAARAAGMKTYAYTDFMRSYPCSGCSATWKDVQANTSMVSTDCRGNKIVVTGGGYELDPRNPQTFSLWLNDEVRPRPGYDAYFADDVGMQPYDIPSVSCNTARLASAIAAGVNAAGIPMVIYNGLPPGPKTDPTVVAVLKATKIPSAAMLEGCYGYRNSWGHKTGVAPSRGWTVEENDEIAVVKTGHLFWCFNTEMSNGDASQADRIFVLASFFLTYNPANSLLEEAYYANPIDVNNFVGPENGLVLTSPRVGEPSDISALQVGATGVYAREYRACYERATAIGPCAVVVNPDEWNAHPYALSGYTRALVLSGGSVFDGGTMSFSGSMPAVLPPSSAVIVK